MEKDSHPFQVMHKIKKVIADPENIVLAEESNNIFQGQDPYSVATQHLINIQRYESFKGRFMKLEPKAQLNIISKIVETMFEWPLFSNSL